MSAYDLSQRDKPLRKETIYDQVNAAKEQIKKLKKVAPYLYHEYAEFIEASNSLKNAQLRFKRAKAVWDAFPDNPRYK